VESHWVENINWMRVASDLEIKTADSFTRRLVWPLARKSKVN